MSWAFVELVPVTATVTGTGAGAGNPNSDGNVTFKDGATTLCSNAAVNAVGVATCSTAALTVGSHPITADYANATNFANSSGTLAGGQTVNQASTSTDVTSSDHPSNFGQSVTFTATVSVDSPRSGALPVAGH